MLEAKAKDQGHKRKCSPKKKVFTKIFQAISTKKHFPKNFSTALQNFNNSKNSAEDRPIFEDLRPRGQGLDLRGQGQGLQNVSSRTPPLPDIACNVIHPQTIACDSTVRSTLSRGRDKHTPTSCSKHASLALLRTSIVFPNSFQFELQLKSRFLKNDRVPVRAKMKTVPEAYVLFRRSLCHATPPLNAKAQRKKS